MLFGKVCVVTSEKFGKVIKEGCFVLLVGDEVLKKSARAIVRKGAELGAS